MSVCWDLLEQGQVRLLRRESLPRSGPLHHCLLRCRGRSTRITSTASASASWQGHPHAFGHTRIWEEGGERRREKLQDKCVGADQRPQNHCSAPGSPSPAQHHPRAPSPCDPSMQCRQRVMLGGELVLGEGRKKEASNAPRSVPRGRGWVPRHGSVGCTQEPAPHTAVSCSALDSSFFLFILQKPWSPQKQAKVNWGITWSRKRGLEAPLRDLDGDRERSQGSS